MQWVDVLVWFVRGMALTALGLALWRWWVLPREGSERDDLD